MIKFAFQSGSIKDEFTDRCIDACLALGIDYKTFGIVPFSGGKIYDLEEFADANVYIPFGSVEIIKLYTTYRISLLPKNWKVFYNKKKFTFREQLKSDVASSLLNSDAKFYKLSSVMDKQFSEDVFIKPNNDLKLFNGQIVETGSTLRNELSTKQIIDSFWIPNAKSKVPVAKRKHTGLEFRAFVVDGKVITSSFYKKYGRPFQAKIDTLPDNVVELALKFQPDIAYVVDFDSPDDTLTSVKIVEYNALQCSGHYKADTQLILKALYEVANK